MKFVVMSSTAFVLSLMACKMNNVDTKSTVRSDTDAAIECSSAQNFYSQLPAMNPGFDTPEKNQKFLEAMKTLIEKVSQPQYCNRASFLNKFKTGSSPVLFAAGPSGLGIPAQNFLPMTMNLTGVVQMASQKKNQNIAELAILSGVSQIESGAPTMDAVLEQLATEAPLGRVPFKKVSVHGAIAGKAYTYGADEKNFPKNLHSVYIPVPSQDRLASEDYDMKGENQLPVKVEALANALGAGRFVVAALYDGGDISYQEMKGLLELVRTGKVNASRLHVHISFGWGFHRADKLSVPAAIRILNEFYSNPKFGEAQGLTTTFGFGPHVNGNPQPADLSRVPSAAEQFSYLAFLRATAGSQIGSLDEKKKGAVQNAFQNIVNYCQSTLQNAGVNCASLSL